MDNSFPLGPVIGNRLAKTYQHKPRLVAALAQLDQRSTALGTVSRDGDGKLQFVPNYAAPDTKPAPAKQLPRRSSDYLPLEPSNTTHNQNSNYAKVACPFKQGDRVRLTLNVSELQEMGVPLDDAEWMTERLWLTVADTKVFSTGNTGVQVFGLRGRDWWFNAGYVALYTSVDGVTHKPPAKPGLRSLETWMRNCQPVEIDAPSWDHHGQRGYISRFDINYTGSHVEAMIELALENGHKIHMLGDVAAQVLREAKPAPGFNPLTEPLHVGDRAEVCYPESDTNGRRGTISQITRDSRHPDDATYELTLDGQPAITLIFHSRSRLKLMRKGDAMPTVVSDPLACALKAGDELEFVAKDWPWIPAGSRCIVTGVEEHWFYVAWKEAAHREIDSAGNWPLDTRRSSFKLIEHAKAEATTKADLDALTTPLQPGDFVEIVAKGLMECGKRGHVTCGPINGIEARVTLENGTALDLYSRSSMKLLRRNAVLQLEGLA